ncbi:MAG: hypothetical protein ACTSO7_12005 [Candidatus Heimdallarchaeota archaeon]
MFYLQKLSIFDHYPNLLPKKYQEQISNDIDKIKIFAETLNDKIKTSHKNVPRNKRTIINDSQKISIGIVDEFSKNLSGLFSNHFLPLYLSYNKLKSLTGDESFANEAFNFVKEARHQQVILSIAYLEAYMKICFQVLLDASPEKIITNFNDLADAVKNTKIENLIENYTLNFQKRIDIFKDKFEILKDFSSEKLERLSYYDQCRHCLVHNFGVIDKKFIWKTQADDSLLGTDLIISDDNVSELEILLQDIELVMFLDICCSHLNRQL